jgi:hypothetical protein
MKTHPGGWIASFYSNTNETSVSETAPVKLTDADIIKCKTE